MAHRQDWRTAAEDSLLKTFGLVTSRRLKDRHVVGGVFGGKCPISQVSGGEDRVGVWDGFGCDRLAGRPHSQDLGTGGEARRHSGLNLNGVQYRLEAGETQGRRTRVEEGQ